MNTCTLDWKKYSTLARSAAAEGCVLLRNENRALPIRSGETVAIFGRIQLDYYKSGTGSGGMVNVPYVHSVLDGLSQYPSVHIYEPLLSRYRDWTREHPFDCGNGWGTEPWCQEEMELTEEIVADAASHADLALIVIGRTAGEDRDNTAQAGSYYLTDAERDMLDKVCRAFSRTAVILNTGNIIDMNWVDEYTPSAVLYIWQGGMEGGYGAADVLCGTVSPCGKLSDTIAMELEDYPSVRNFGSAARNFYQEDIYIGYRYFETFARDRVRYPFGFGLSYTSFSINAQAEAHRDDSSLTCTVTATVSNTGKCAGKEVVQVYVCPPQGHLGKPLRNLVSFAKTGTLQPGSSETLTLTFAADTFASYDDSGVTGNKSCCVLESGEYVIYVGADVRSAIPAGTFYIEETEIISRHSEALAPVTPFERIRPQKTQDASMPYIPVMESVPMRTVSPSTHRSSHPLPCLPFSGDRGFQLSDVQDGTVTMDEFLAQLSDDDLMTIVKGEGMCSPKVTPGTAAAYGGITDSLSHFGIPAACCSDGPSGIRMDCGTSAFSLPNGTLLACTFNLPLVTELFEMEGLELYSNQIDALLGPGINIHRCPLNGRNFEYHSEDPYLTGKMAQAQLSGMNRFGVSGTMKHFCANNQEYFRHTADGVISERALREIYLKPFELGVRSGCARSIMTSYGPVNGIWTAGSYDLNTVILRGEWGYQGLVMTDWWAKANDEGGEPSPHNLAAMIRAQNDVYMVTSDAASYDDNLKSSLADNTLTRAELVRSAGNICRFLLSTPAMQRMRGTYTTVTHVHTPAELSLMPQGDLEYTTVTDSTCLSLEKHTTAGGSSFLLALSFQEEGIYDFSLTASCSGLELAQMAVTLTMDSTVLNVYSFHGSDHTPVTLSREKEVRGTTHYLKFFFAQSGLTLHSLEIKRIRPL